MFGKSMLAYIPVNVANLLVSFGNIIVLTRLLDGDEYGRYATAIISIQFFHMLLLTWLEASMARYHARAERCLLYTSPSPRDQRGSRMPSSA